MTVRALNSHIYLTSMLMAAGLMNLGCADHVESGTPSAPLTTTSFANMDPAETETMAAFGSESMEVPEAESSPAVNNPNADAEIQPEGSQTIQDQAPGLSASQTESTSTTDSDLADLVP